MLKMGCPLLRVLDLIWISTSRVVMRLTGSFYRMITMCLTMFDFALNMFKTILKNIIIHLGCPKKIPPNMFRALSTHPGTFSGQNRCQLLRTLPTFTPIQAKAGVVR